MTDAPPPETVIGHCPRCGGRGGGSMCGVCDGRGTVSFPRVFTAAEDALLEKLFHEGRSASYIAISLNPIRSSAVVAVRIKELRLQDTRPTSQSFVQVRRSGSTLLSAVDTR